jgi:hypothetical protein
VRELQGISAVGFDPVAGFAWARTAGVILSETWPAPAQGRLAALDEERRHRDSGATSRVQPNGSAARRS